MTCEVEGAEVTAPGLGWELEVIGKDGTVWVEVSEEAHDVTRGE